MSEFFEESGRKYQQVQSLRDVTKTNFPNGQIRFHWNIPAQESWNPYLSFFTLRNDFSKFIMKTSVDTTAEFDVNPSIKIAPSMFFNDSLWQSLEFQINGVAICKHDNYVHQIAALKHRLKSENKNKSLDKLNFTDISLEERSQKIGPGGNGDDKTQIESGDLYDTLPNIGIQIDQTLAGNEATILFAGTSFIAKDYFEVGDILYIKNDEDGEYVQVTITSVQINEVNFIAPTIISLNNGAPASLATNEILYPGIIKKNKKEQTNYKEFETIWKPKLSIFDVNKWLPGGDYEIILTPFPESSYRKNAIEISPKTYALISDVNYFVINMELNLCTSIMPSSLASIELAEIKCQTKTINTTSLSQKQFNINPNTYSLTIAYQDNRVSTDYRFNSSFFRVWETDDELLYKPGWELNLSRFYISYDGNVLPNPIPDIKNNSTQKFISQRYWESQMYKIEQYLEIETLEEWKNRGTYYHFRWPRTTMRATELQVSQEFGNSTLPTGVTPQLLLFEHFKLEYAFDLANGYIQKVKRKV